ncbi:alkaline phosphatase domain-containing protein [Sphaerospermopsis reniformis]|uniref:Alkaline phosphatase domain-containing protein n=1 Tax=Sphaerospermopsis reniformis TaxID=531300 RepID=A0A480A4J7_9CYAN|nr:BREX-6 system phosphatase PglZ [Sphaerospermopsis reniformis]GCL39442.1 alkaline phosphatase domain-containing protein [Sphaerospermopsis reniformis]
MSIITNYLKTEIEQKLREQGIVIWLDKDAHYNNYVDELITRHRQGEFFAPVVAFRGSYLEMLFALEPYGNGLVPETLLIHMPGHTEDTIRKTPILELYRAGYRFRKALDTLIREASTGQVTPTELENYLSQGVSDLATAETWLENTLSQPQDSLAKYLENFSLEWILEGLLDLDNIIDEAKKLRVKFPDTHSLDTLTQHLYRHTGMDEAFLQFYYNQETLSFSRLGEAFAAWLMCVEYVQNLNRLPHLPQLQPLSQLSLPLRKNCKQLIEYLRQRYPDTYAAQAVIVESHLEPELQTLIPEELSKIQTFQWGENAVLAAAVQALLAGNYSKVLTWSKPRTETPTFWLERHSTQRIEWTLIQAAATLGDKINNSGRIKTLDNLRAVLEYYTDSGYQVDLAHRRFEQQYVNLPDLPHFAQLLEATEQLRRQYRVWADNLAQDFSDICQKDSFLPEADLQQRTIYDQVVHPLTQNNHKKVAYFLIDAFRYEMATELLQDFTEAGSVVSLKGRYAELPSITAVGMNALTPVSQGGKLLLAGDNGFKGFKTGEYTVRSPQERVRAIKDKSVSQHGKESKEIVSFNLTEVRNCTASKLKKTCANARLIIIHSREIDDAGEANLGLATFETWLGQIKSAWNHLKNAGINEFILTADHGFLLQDHTTKEKNYGSKKDPYRRYILDSEPRSEEGCVTVSLSSLKYEGQNKYLIFCKDTSVFATGNPGATFVHGGNSLQERVIPVLKVSQRYNSLSGMVKYLIEAQADNNRIRLRVKPAPLPQSVLNFTESKTINLAFHVPNRQDIQITIKDVIGAKINNQQLQIPVTDEWVEVGLDLRGQRDERVRIEIFHPDGIEDVEATIPQEYFDVSGSLKTEVSTTQTPSSNDWQNSFEDQAIAQVFLHLQKHNSITEIELTQILGNPRKTRRFALDFEEYLKKVPFLVRIETTNNGKRYVKQN